VWDTVSSSCATPSTCAPNYSATSLGSAGFNIPGATPPLTCFCPSSFINTGIGVSHGTYGGCKCPTAEHFINSGGSCATCPTAAKPTSSSPPPLGQTLPAPNSECGCPGVDEYYSNGLGCTSCSTTYPGSVRVGTGGAGATVTPSSGNCVCKNANETWNTATNGCEAPTTEPLACIPEGGNCMAAPERCCPGLVCHGEDFGSRPGGGETSWQGVFCVPKEELPVLPTGGSAAPPTTIACPAYTYWNTITLSCEPEISVPPDFECQMGGPRRPGCE
jgi:hypothetical protein